MVPLHVSSERKLGHLSDSEKLFTPFIIKAAFQSCAADPLLYLAGLRGGIMRYDSDTTCVPVPSSYAFSTFSTQSSVGNRLSDGSALGAECIAALVLAAHRYQSFRGTPFFEWLALVVAELNWERDFKVADITTIPDQLRSALQDVMVPLLSPPNSPWGASMDSGINFGNFSWCKHQERRDASVPLSITHAVDRLQGEDDQDLEMMSGSSRSLRELTATPHSARSSMM